LVKVDQHIDDRDDAEEGEKEVIPDNPIFIPLEGWKDQEGKKEDEHDMDSSQHLRHDHPKGGGDIEMDE
jgi:hypothetical protein